MYRFTTPTARVRVECSDPQQLLQGAHFFTIARKKPNGRFEALFDLAPVETKIFDDQLFMYVSLTQEQTGMFADNEVAYLQLTTIAANGARQSSDMQAFRLKPTLKAQVVEYTGTTTESEAEDE